MCPFLNEPLKSPKKMFFGRHIKDGRQNINFLKIVTEVKYPVIKVKGLRGDVRALERGLRCLIESMDRSRTEADGPNPSSTPNTSVLRSCLLYTSPSPRDGLLSR